MTSDEYLQSVIGKYKAPEYDYLTELMVINPLREKIQKWAGSDLIEVKKSGSRAKGTAISVTSDYDLFISLSKDTAATYKEIYESLYNLFASNSYSARKQNVSIGITTSGHKIDLTPGKKHTGNTNYHNIYRSKVDSWTQTNIDLQITTVAGSGRINEIILMKIWRYLRGLSFPSMYLELIVLEALSYKSKNDLANNILAIFKYLRDSFIDKVIIDPSNTNNKISDDLYKYEKEAIVSAAKEDLAKDYWSQIVW